MSQLNKACNYGALLYWNDVKEIQHQQKIRNEYD